MGVNVAIVGATGLVGQVIRQVLEDRAFPLKRLRLLASARSVGTKLPFGGEELVVEPLRADAFTQTDIVLSSTPAAVSREFSPLAAQAGAVVIDNSSAFRMDPSVPLIVPEVNRSAIRQHRGIIANPNCSTIQMLVALKPLHDLAKIKRVVVSTYQASSGKGQLALAELDGQLAAVGQGKEIPPASVHRAQLAMNCVPHDWTMGEDGFTEEEHKMIRETRKILGEPNLAVCPTCVRVPVRVGHSESINVEFYKPVDLDEARAALRNAPGIVLLDDPQSNEVPMPLLCENRDETFVGRVRRDPSVAHGLSLWVVADNLRKGAATNAVQIAECLVADLAMV